MKKLFLPLLALVILSILGYVAYSGRYQIATKVWHWRHGNAVHVGGYQVPVPDNWLVLNITSSAVQLLNTQAKEHSDPAFPVNASITVSSLRAPVPDLDSWKAIKQQWFGRDGQHTVVERELRFENERVLCVVVVNCGMYSKSPTRAFSLLSVVQLVRLVCCCRGTIRLT